MLSLVLKKSVFFLLYYNIQGVTGGMCQTSGESSLC